MESIQTINSNGKTGEVSDTVKVGATEDSSAKVADKVEKLKDNPLQEEKKETMTKKVSKAKEEGANETLKFSHTINAPLVGTFYSSAGPGKPPLVKIGDKVKKGDKVCMVEAMKLFNEIQALDLSELVKKVI